MGDCGENVYICTNFISNCTDIHNQTQGSLNLSISMRFIGDYTAKTDAKGRVFLPAAFRRALIAEGEQMLVLRRDVFQKCLVLYPIKVWDKQLEELQNKLNPWNSKDQMMLRQFVADAEQIELDSQGRLLMSKGKLQYAEITTDVRFLALVDRIEIWSKHSFEEMLAQGSSLGADIEMRFGQDNMLGPGEDKAQ